MVIYLLRLKKLPPYFFLNKQYYFKKFKFKQAKRRIYFKNYNNFLKYKSTLYKYVLKLYSHNVYSIAYVLTFLKQNYYKKKKFKKNFSRRKRLSKYRIFNFHFINLTGLVDNDQRIKVSLQYKLRFIQEYKIWFRYNYIYKNYINYYKFKYLNSRNSKIFLKRIPITHKQINWSYKRNIFKLLKNKYISLYDMILYNKKKNNINKILINQFYYEKLINLLTYLEFILMKKKDKEYYISINEYKIILINCKQIIILLIILYNYYYNLFNKYNLKNNIKRFI